MFSIASLGLKIPTRPGAWLLPILVWAAVLTFNGLYGVVVTEMGWDSLEPPDLPFDTFGAGSLAITGLLVIVLGPFAEEVFFRGFVMAGLARRWGPAVGIVASSLLFSLAHGSVALIVPIFVCRGAAGLALSSHRVAVGQHNGPHGPKRRGLYRDHSHLNRWGCVVPDSLCYTFSLQDET